MSATLAADEFTTMETREASPTHFLIKVQSLYKSGIEKFETKEFVAGDYKWKLIIYPNGDKIGKACEHVSVNLAMVDTSSLPACWEINAVFSIFLFNQISANYLCSLGITRRFLAMKTQWGISKFISKKVMSEPSNGYLVDDTCVFGAEVFVVKKEAAVIERLCLKNFDIPYKRDWKISNFSKLGNIWASEEFTAGGHKWEIRLYPKGNEKGAGTNVSIYLYYAGLEKVQACFTIWLKNQVSDEHKKRTAINWFSSKTDWGWHSFIEIAAINNRNKGFIVDDCCVLDIEISSVQAAG